VTEPDPIAALAAQLEELRGQLARYTGETGHLRTRLNEDSGQVVMLRLEIKQLAEKIEAAIARRNADEPQAPYLLGLSREEYGSWLAELRAWVGRVGLGQYPGYFERLPACWPNHPEAVTELSNVMTEWARVYSDPDNRDLAAALIWHDRWLPGVLSRLTAAIKCDASGCRRLPVPREHSPPRYT
jgi:hypothetical protein